MQLWRQILPIYIQQYENLVEKPASFRDPITKILVIFFSFTYAFSAKKCAASIEKLVMLTYYNIRNLTKICRDFLYIVTNWSDYEICMFKTIDLSKMLFLHFILCLISAWA